MTNPTRTRAEIQADETAKIDQQIQELQKKRRALTACWISGHRLPDSEYGSRKVEILMGGGTPLTTHIDDSVECIPAADLIPRAEHERAVDQARKTISARDAVAYLANEYQMDISPMDESPTPRPYTHIGGDMRHYRVTVERVSDAPESESEKSDE